MPKSRAKGAEPDSAEGDQPPSALLTDPGLPPARSEDALSALSPKGLRTRQRLLDGARRAFEKSGSYADTRINDIVKETGCAYGTFYTYFDTKEQLFYELAVDVANEMYRENASRARGADLVARIDSGLRQFLLSYREHAGILAIIDQAAALYPEFRGLRRRIRDVFVDRNVANFQRWSEDGWFDPAIDPVVAAHALVSMIDNFSYLWFVLGEPFEEEKALATLSRLWTNALAVPSNHPAD
ncbi:TetR family transcriptional regulator [Nocardioides soli]|uniref:AcrR family transcriptional regulator n=1 Tax=Nocardioides soli TaxID=1036020 RepID=A0A7W4Z1H1_9ACTN|nr:AcrR family transcriptional regulator [Nocardioides soli]